MIMRKAEGCIYDIVNGNGCAKIWHRAPVKDGINYTAVHIAIVGKCVYNQCGVLLNKMKLM